MRFLLWIAVGLMLVGAGMLIGSVGAAGMWIAVIAIGVAMVAIHLRHRQGPSIRRTQAH